MEVIPDDEIPKKKERKKKVMTETMLEQLKIARQKALEVKKALKESDELKIEHAKEKIKKAKTKTKTQKIKEEAEKQLEAEEAKPKDEPIIENEVIEAEEEKPIGKLVDLASEEAIENLKKEEGMGTPSPPPPLPAGEGIEVPKMELEVPIKKPKSPKKQAYLFSSDSESSDDERVIYVKKRSKKKKEKKEEMSYRPAQPVNVNLYQRGLPPSLVEARNGMNSLFSNRYR